MVTSVRAAVQLARPAAFEFDVPLVAVQRGGYVGSLHRGTAVAANHSGEVVISLGDPAQPVFLRSGAKPFQVMPALLTGAINRFAIDERELAVLCASHSAEERHTETILAILAKAGLSEDALKCGVHPPLSERTARERTRAGVEPSLVCNNCSGAHTGMLLACVAAGWPIETYGESDHPLQVMTREVLSAFAAVPVGQVELGVDNCAVPAFRIPIANAAQAFARMVTGRGVASELRAAARRVVRAMTGHPEMVAGEDRFDTELMSASDGTVLSKGGAEGFQGIAIRDSGLGIAIKISDGNARAIPPVSLRLLTSLGALEPPARERLSRYSEPELHNHRGQNVGRLVPLFEIGEVR